MTTVPLCPLFDWSQACVAQTEECEYTNHRRPHMHRLYTKVQTHRQRLTLTTEYGFVSATLLKHTIKAVTSGSSVSDSEPVID